LTSQKVTKNEIEQKDWNPFNVSDLMPKNKPRNYQFRGSMH